MLVRSFEQAKGHAVHPDIGIHVDAVEDSVLITLEELQHEVWDGREFGITRLVQ